MPVECQTDPVTVEGTRTKAPWGPGKGEERAGSGKVLAAESVGKQVFFPFFLNKEASLEAPEEDRGLGRRTRDRMTGRRLSP